MSRLTPIVEALVAAGATPDMILAAVRAHEDATTADLEARRRNDAERQARRRDRKKALTETPEHEEVTECHVTSRDVTVTERDAPRPLPPSPQTPQPPTPTPGEQSRPRKGLPVAKPEADLTERIWQAASKVSRARSGRPALGKAVLAAIRAGATDGALIGSVRDHCREQGEFAKGVDRIVAGEHWRDHPDGGGRASTAEPPSPALIAHRLQHFSKTGEWKPAWGPKPANDATDTPLIAEGKRA